MNGTGDPILPFNGEEMASDREVISTPDYVSYWVNRNGVNDTETAFYQIINGEHTNPSISERNSDMLRNVPGNQNGDIEMAEEIWRFFKYKTKQYFIQLIIIHFLSPLRMSSTRYYSSICPATISMPSRNDLGE